MTRAELGIGRKLTDFPKCNTCAHAGEPASYHQGRRGASIPRLWCARWRKDVHAFGLCEDHEARPETVRPETNDPRQLPLL